MESPGLATEWPTVFKRLRERIASETAWEWRGNFKIDGDSKTRKTIKI